MLPLFIKGILTDRGAQEMLIEWYWDVAELVEYLSHKHKALGLTPSTEAVGLGGTH